LKTYAINDILQDKSTVGKINITFASNSQNTGTISDLHLSTDNDHLFFNVTKNGYGPMQYSLDRIDEANTSLSAQEFNELMVGEWEGNVSTKWVYPYQVSFVFNSDNSYTSEALTMTSAPQGDLSWLKPALHLGVDGAIAGKIFSIDNVDENGLASGDITIAFVNGASKAAEIRDAQISQDNKFLSFKVHIEGIQSPLTYLLKKKN
jgi:hypothetical protein